MRDKVVEVYVGEFRTYVPSWVGGERTKAELLEYAQDATLELIQLGKFRDELWDNTFRAFLDYAGNQYCSVAKSLEAVRSDLINALARNAELEAAIRRARSDALEDAAKVADSYEPRCDT
jgi:hypothetical protein